MIKLSRGGFLHEVKKNKILFLMLLPAVTFFIVFSYLPMSGIYLAFTRFDLVKGIFKSPFVGFENFRFLHMSGVLLTITKNTVLYNLAFILIGSVLQITTAIFINELSSKLFKKISQSLMFLPYFISYVLIGTFVYQLFHYEYGTLNNVLQSIGMEAIDASSNIGMWKYVILFFYIWKNLGYGMVIYLAAISNINEEYYEAAKIDGAGILKRIWYITLPMIKPTFIILFLFSIGNILKGQFELFYQIIGDNGMLFESTEIIDTYVFRSMVNFTDYGLISAAGLYQSFFGFILIMIVNTIVKKLNPDYALF